MTSAARLGEQKYVSLTTYRKDGTPIATPLWVAADGDALVVWTVTDSWKVRRIRRNPEVAVAPCDLRGRVTGESVPGRAEILTAEESARVRNLIGKKYGLLGRITMAGSRLRRGATGTVGIRIFC